MTPNELAGNFDLNLYNGLWAVEDADAAVRQDGALFDFLEASANIFFAHNMQDRFGVGLLHRHNKCVDGERMVQYRELFENQDALVTRPVTNPPQATPSIWALEGDAFRPLEFTTDPLAADMLMREDIPNGFIDAFRKVASDSPIGNLLGLAVVSREFYANAKPEEIALEYANLLPRSNVLMLADRSAVDGKPIQTAWRFKKPDAIRAQRPVPVCTPVSNCETTSICVTICHAGEGGQHSGQQVHTPKDQHKKVTLHIIDP